MNANLATEPAVPRMPPVPLRAGAAATASRYDIYSNAHKALRLAFGETLTAAGRIDPQDDIDVARLSDQVRALLKFCRVHLDKEESFVHPMIEAGVPGAAAATREDHQAHLAAFEQIETELRTLETARPDSRSAAHAQLYRHLAIFVADNLLHMDVEETANNAALWAAYTDGELRALEQRLVASIPPEALQLGLRWMIPALTPGERAALLLEMRERVPAAAFAGVLAGAQVNLTDAERRKLQHALDE
jgi:hypothetical protein